jgi:acyl-coenzyme A synthetase/AMP-(fatty) acid ligase
VDLCKSRLQRYQYPHIVEFEEDLPKTMTGKIQRFALRARPPTSRTVPEETGLK